MEVKCGGGITCGAERLREQAQESSPSFVAGSGTTRTLHGVTGVFTFNTIHFILKI